MHPPPICSVHESIRVCCGRLLARVRRQVHRASQTQVVILRWIEAVSTALPVGGARRPASRRSSRISGEDTWWDSFRMSRQRHAARATRSAASSSQDACPGLSRTAAHTYAPPRRRCAAVPTPASRGRTCDWARPRLPSAASDPRAPKLEPFTGRAGRRTTEADPIKLGASRAARQVVRHRYPQPLIRAFC